MIDAAGEANTSDTGAEARDATFDGSAPESALADAGNGGVCRPTSSFFCRSDARAWPRSATVSGHAGCHTCYVLRMAATTKVTANIPTSDLARARRLTGRGITQTLVEGLRAIDREAGRHELRALRGKVRVTIDLERTRR